MKNFALIGSAGYIAERHIRAIGETGNNLICCLDISEVMGRIDRYFKYAEFFTDKHEFFDHIANLKGTRNQVDYVSICTPNDTHMEFILDSLESGCDVICEKPMVISNRQIQLLEKFIDSYEKQCYGILQLRYHAEIIELRSRFLDTNKRHKVKLEYITPRGKWYFKTWKTNPRISGGLAMNIGVHFFDMLIWIFGDVIDFKLLSHNEDFISGSLTLKSADVDWFLSIATFREKPERIIEIDGEKMEFSQGFTDLHTSSYQNILNGNGFTIKDTKYSIILAEQIQKKITSHA